MVVRSHWLPDKAEAVADRGMVVAKHALAAEAGIEILADGGNAVDAAVATGFALCVVKPMMTCIGGIGYLLMHDALTGEQWCFDGAPRAPRAAGADTYEVVGENTDGIGLYRVRDDANTAGHRAVAVPGVVAILCSAHERHGRLPLSRVMEPAIRLSAAGWPVDWLTVAHTANGMSLLSRNAAAAAIFLPAGRPPAWGPPAERLVQRDLAETLRRIARHGAQAFYEGEIAEAIERDMREHGGLITREDLAGYPRRVERPLSVSYRGVQVLFPAMPCGATTSVETLRILERFDVAAAGQNTVEGLHLFIEAARRAYADRFHYLGDPDFVPVPLAGLLSEGHADEQAALVGRERASMIAGSEQAPPWARYASTVPPGDPWRFDSNPRPDAAMPVAAGVLDDGDTCTTHFAVVDADGTAVNCTITAAGLFGAGVVTPSTGILWNNGMTWFNPMAGTANSIAPGKRALTNMSPVIVLRDGRPWFVVGAPGGRKIINAVAQVVSNVVDHGMRLQQAITAPRVDASANETLADIRLDPAVVEGLRERGHTVTVVEDSPAQAMFSRPLGILIDPETGRLHSGLSPAHMAEARGI
jgi:gamma-glutamyltranspeptidase/glutathione hydrolase